MSDRVCVVFAAGEYYGACDAGMVPQGAFVVAADGGLDHARAAGVSPHVVVGDFDSLRGAPPSGAGRTVALPPMKDDPDLLSALKIGWSEGCRLFHVYGALGGRVDHSLSAVNLTALVAHHGGVVFLHGDGQVVTSVCDGALSFPAHEAEPGGMVSVFSHSDVSVGVDEPGLRYELRDGVLRGDMVQGVSNEFRARVPASIGVREGTLTVVFPASAPLPEVTWRHAFTGDLGALDTSVSSLLVR